ncbi:MAG: PD40 domain-containing protein [Candidatus Zixiibacteriota bacterium]|nr:MAG: PD40 domain-containing protein [candidate division Zixibacteria bacterium]
MRKTLPIVLIAVLVLSVTGSAQETYFGKNKVRYKNFDWDYIQTRHFDIYFYEDAYPSAKFSAAVLESAYVEVTGELDYVIQRRIPVFIYNSHYDFQQTNIIPNLISEGIGGFTEVFKNRVVVPFSGSYEEFRHVLHHEVTHAVIYDMLYGNMFSSLLSRQRLFALPDWFAEGYAEYSSAHGWDYFSDMFMRDGTITGYLTPPWVLGGYLAYRQGQAMVKYIADKYGEDQLGKILRKGKVHLTMNRALKETIGKTEEEFWEEFTKEMKKRYWPEIAIRKEPSDFARQLTYARKDGSYFNEKPAFSPDGDKIAIFTDKSDYTELVLISAQTGQLVKRLVKGERSGDLESLHSYVSGASFSPDGKRLVFVAKSDGKPTLMFYDIRKGGIYQKKRFDFRNIVSPVWSPDGEKVAFSALKGYKRDLFVYNIESDTYQQLTDDRFDDVSPSWLPHSDELIFASDRPHPATPISDAEANIYVATPGAYMPGDFTYGYYNLFRLDLGDNEISPLDLGPGQNSVPVVSPDGSKAAFISNRNGIDNIYIAYLDSVRYFAVTDILTGVRSLSWSPDGEKLAFSAFHKGAYDIFVMKDIAPSGDNGILAATDYIKGKYDLLQRLPVREQLAEVAPPTEAEEASEEPPVEDDPYAPDYETYDVESETLAGVEDEPAADTAAAQPIDSSSVAAEPGPEPSAEDEPPQDSVITTTGIHDGEFVFVSSDQPDDDFDALLVDVPDDSTSLTGFTRMEEPASFDSIPAPLPDGNYEVHQYKVRFTPDYVGGGLSYDTFFGLRGQSYFVFSDYLGNHQIYLATDLVNTIDQSNIQAFYFYNRHRTNYGIGVFHTKNFYLDANDFLFSDRFYGLQTYAARPFSIFSRIEAYLSQYFIDRQYYDFGDLREDRSSKVTTAELAYITDNIIWGFTGPVNGRRAKLTVSGGVNLFDSRDIEFTAAELDLRKYWHLRRSFSFAVRLSGGASFGKTPKQYFLGGTTNWIGNRTLDAEVFEVENLYFADVVTPLRGIPYYDLSGDRYGLFNAEFRFPLIDYFAMRFPLPIVISRVGGALFTDVGAAWFGSDFKGGSSEDGGRLQDIKVGFGFGMRMNLGFFLLRYDLAWSTDLKTISDKPSYYFSFGADF